MKTTTKNTRDIIAKLSHSEAPIKGYSCEINTNAFIASLADGTLHPLDSGLKPINDDKWHYVVVTFDRDQDGTLYVDGSKGKLTSISTWNKDISNTQAFEFARTNIKPTSTFFAGTLDEVRISTTVRSDSWIVTAFNNIADPEGFLTLGEQRTPPP